MSRTFENLKGKTKGGQSKNELLLVTQVKDSKKGFYKYTSQKRMTKEAMGPLLNSQGELFLEYVKKAELLNR